MPLAVGTRVGDIEIVGPLGAGGMGEVYRGRDTKLDSESGRPRDAVVATAEAYGFSPAKLVSAAVTHRYRELSSVDKNAAHGGAGAGIRRHFDG